MPIEGIIDKPAKEGHIKLRLRFCVGSGTYGPHKWNMTVNADSKLVFIEFKGKSAVAYKTKDLLHDALTKLQEAGEIQDG